MCISLSLPTKPYPRIASGRGKGKHQVGKFFGPYPSAYNAGYFVGFAKLFNVRQCRNSYFSQRKRPCLQYQIKRCSAPCVGLISPEEYKMMSITRFVFTRGHQRAESRTDCENGANGRSLKFEKAVFYRDRMALLRMSSLNKLFINSKVRPIF